MRKLALIGLMGATFALASPAVEIVDASASSTAQTTTMQQDTAPTHIVQREIARHHRRHHRRRHHRRHRRSHRRW